LIGYSNDTSHRTPSGRKLSKTGKQMQDVSRGTGPT
jgi:hypothetical protein